jgi:hypothetical protein
MRKYLGGTALFPDRYIVWGDLPKENRNLIWSYVSLGFVPGLGDGAEKNVRASVTEDAWKNEPSVVENFFSCGLDSLLRVMDLCWKG